MLDVLLRAAALVFIILMANVLKRIGLFRKDDYRTVAAIVMNITLPAAVITGFSVSSVQVRLLLFTLIGFCANWAAMFCAMLLSRGKQHSYRAVWLNVSAGFNIGAFSLPFVQSFLSPASLVACCMFDSGNAMMCNGGTYATASALLESSEKRSARFILRRLFSSVPFICYLTMLVLSLIGISFPQRVISFISPISAANPFMAMFMIGLMLDFNFPREARTEVLRIVLFRILAAFCFAALFYFWNPMGEGKTLALVSFAPTSVTCTSFSEKCGGDPKVTGCVSSITIMFAVVMMSLVVMFL